MRCQCATPSFITHDELEGTAHPAVVLIIMDVGGNRRSVVLREARCSLFLLEPKLPETVRPMLGRIGSPSVKRS